VNFIQKIKQNLQLMQHYTATITMGNHLLIIFFCHINFIPYSVFQRRQTLSINE